MILRFLGGSRLLFTAGCTAGGTSRSKKTSRELLGDDLSVPMRHSLARLSLRAAVVVAATDPGARQGVAGRG